MDEAKAYSLVKLEETVTRGIFEFKYAVLRLFPVNYRAPVAKNPDGTYFTEERTQPSGSVLLYFERKDEASAVFAAL